MLQQNNQTYAWECCNRTILGRSTVCLYICVYKTLGPFNACYMPSALVVSLYVCMYVYGMFVAFTVAYVKHHIALGSFYIQVQTLGLCARLSPSSITVYAFSVEERGQGEDFFLRYLLVLQNMAVLIGLGGKTTTRSTHIRYAQYIRFAFPHSLTSWHEVNVIVYWPHQPRWVRILRAHDNRGRVPAASVVEKAPELETSGVRFARIDDHGQSMQNISHASNVQVSLRRWRRKLYEIKNVASNVNGNTATVNSVFWLLVWGVQDAFIFCQGISWLEISMLNKLVQVLSKLLFSRGKSFLDQNLVYRLFRPWLLNRPLRLSFKFVFCFLHWYWPLFFLHRKIAFSMSHLLRWQSSWLA